MVLSAISSLAGSLGKLFMPYAKIVLEDIAVPLVSQERTSMAELRGRATEMVGVVAAAIGKEAFSSYLPFFFQHALQVPNAPPSRLSSDLIHLGCHDRRP